MEFVATGGNDPQEFPGFEFFKAKDAGLKHQGGPHRHLK